MRTTQITGAAKRPHREERHEREQYFFDDTTRRALADFVGRFENPCCLCAPTVAEELAARGRDVHVLDIDERFAGLPGFVPFDIHRPRCLNETYDLIFCDPPFFTVSLSALFSAVRLLHEFEPGRPLLMTYLTRRAQAVESVFAPMGLTRTDLRPGYLTVQSNPRNDIVLFSNFPIPKDLQLTDPPRAPRVPRH